MRTKDEQLEELKRMALEFNAAMPVDVMLKGDGSIWFQRCGNDVKARKATQEDVLYIVFTAIEYGKRAISV